MKNIIPNDQEVLVKIFFPDHQSWAVQEAELKVLGPESILGYLDFGKTSNATGFESQRFHFINNPDGSIRWLYPTSLRKPIFLKLYNGSGWRGLLFKTVFRILFALRLNNLLKAGSVTVFYKKDWLINSLPEPLQQSGFAIFTGTVGDNRKAVIALTDEQQADWFYKLPLTKSAEKLVRHEQHTLHSLNEYSFRKIHFPEASIYGTGVLLSNVRPIDFQNSFELQPLHFEAITELILKTSETNLLKNLPCWNEIGTTIEAIGKTTITNDLSSQLVDKTTSYLKELFRSLDPEISIPTSMAHGDFTPWNMYPAEKKLHVYDWELSERLPMLYDAFHFIFQSGILIKRLPFSEIHLQILALKSNPTIQQLLLSESADFEQLYHFYLLRNVSYYLLKYIQQAPLHHQAHWLVSTWTEALEEVAGKIATEKNIAINGENILQVTIRKNRPT